MSGELTTTAPHGALAIRTEQRAAFAQIGDEDAPYADQLVFLTPAQRTGLTHSGGSCERPAASSPRTSTANGSRRPCTPSRPPSMACASSRSAPARPPARPPRCGAVPMVCGRTCGWTPPRPPQPRPAPTGTGSPSRCWAVAQFASYAPTNRVVKLTGQWPTMPDVMIATCGEAPVLRKAFPQDLSGLSTAEELAQADDRVEAHARRQARAASPTVEMVPVRRAKNERLIALGYAAELNGTDAGAALIAEVDRNWAESGAPQDNHLSVQRPRLAKLIADALKQRANTIEGEVVAETPAQTAETTADPYDFLDSQDMAA